MALQGKVKPYNLRTHDPALGHGTNQLLDWVVQSLNFLIGQQIQGGPGLAAISPNAVNPGGSQITSIGSRPQSATTSVIFTSTTTSISFFWDGTNASVPLQIYRDDGTLVPAIFGNQSVTGLAASTHYFFYMYYDEGNGKVVFAGGPGAVGTPPIAFPTANLPAAQLQFGRNHIPLALTLSTTGVTTPASGTGGGSGGGGGGGGGHQFF